jgi:hypothetical protein
MTFPGFRYWAFSRFSRSLLDSYAPVGPGLVGLHLNVALCRMKYLHRPFIHSYPLFTPGSPAGKIETITSTAPKFSSWILQLTYLCICLQKVCMETKITRTVNCKPVCNHDRFRGKKWFHAQFLLFLWIG